MKKISTEEAINRLVEIVDRMNKNLRGALETIKIQQNKIEELEKKIDKLPDFAEWYIKNSGGGYQE